MSNVENQTNGVVVKSDGLVRALGAVLPFAGKDDMLPVLTGVHVVFDGDRLRLETTDRFSAGFATVDIDAGATGGVAFDVLIPADAVARIVKTFKPAARDAHFAALILTVDGKQLTVADYFGLGSMTTELLDGEFPRMREILRGALSGVENGSQVAGAGFNPAMLVRIDKAAKALGLRNPSARVHATGSDAKPFLVTLGDRTDWLGLLMPRRDPGNQAGPVLDAWRGLIAAVARSEAA